jgi:hypothetical protein
MAFFQSYLLCFGSSTTSCPKQQEQCTVVILILTDVPECFGRREILAATFKFGSVACELTREQHEIIAAAAATTTTTITATTTESILESFPTYAKSLQCLCSNYDTTVVYC